MANTANQQTEVDKYIKGQVKSNGQSRDSERAYPYGMKANPPVGTRCMMWLSNACSGQAVSTPVTPANSQLPKGKAGDVIVGDPESGHYMVFNASGIKMVGNVEVEGNMVINGTLKTTEDITCEKNIVALGNVTCVDLNFTGNGTGTGTLTASDCKTTSGKSLESHPHSGGSYLDGQGNAVTGQSGPPL